MQPSKLRVFLLLVSIASAACTDDADDMPGMAATQAGTSGASTMATEGPSTMATTVGTTTTEPGTGTLPPATTTAPPDTDAMPTVDMGVPTDIGRLRLVHLAVNAPDFDVFVDGNGPVVQGLTFRDGTDYGMLLAGDHVVQIAESGTSADQALVTTDVALEIQGYYTAVIVGDAEETMGAPGLEVITIVDDTEGIAAEDVRITLVHAAPAFGEVDVYEISDPMRPMLLVENTPFGMVATLADMPAGPLEIGVDIDDDAMWDPTFTIPDAGLGGMHVHAYATSDAMGNLALLAQLPDGNVLPIPANM